MAFNVKIISKETIKPSSPTPDHLRSLKLSLLDQQMFQCPVPVLLFYAAVTSGSADKTKFKLDCLKDSLSRILTHFYPLAGRVNNNSFANCNDEGVNFIEARVNVELNQILTNPKQEEMSGLLPYDQDWSRLLSVQVNIFDCGGIVLGVCIGHKVADASSFSLFCNSWAAMTRGDYDDNTSHPKFDMASIFPPKEVDIPNDTLPFETQIQKTVCKRFIFNASNISALKAKCSNSSYVDNPTRVEAVSSLLWLCAMNAKKKNSSSSSSAMHQSVNLRPRMDPPLSNLYMGNSLISTVATSPADTDHPPELQFLVGQVRESFRRVDSYSVKKLLGVEDGLSLHNASLEEVFVQNNKGEVDLYLLTIWCRIPFYEVDFGWGTPAWVTTPNFYIPNFFRLMDTKCGDGVEAYAALLEEDMARFEAQPDLLAFASPT